MSRRDARISLALAILSGVAGILLLGLGLYSSTPGACGHPEGCMGGRDATPLTGIAIGGVLLGIAWAGWRKARQLSRA